MMLSNFPSGKLTTVLKGVFAVRRFGDYAFAPSETNLNSPAVMDNFNRLKPNLLRINGKRFYIGSDVQTADTKETTKEPSRPYQFLPVYGSMAFGSPCLGRLVATESGDFIGSVYGYRIKINPNNLYEWTKKDGSVISFAIAEVEKKLTRWY